MFPEALSLMKNHTRSYDMKNTTTMNVAVIDQIYGIEVAMEISMSLNVDL